MYICMFIYSNILAFIYIHIQEVEASQHANDNVDFASRPLNLMHGYDDGSTVCCSVLHCVPACSSVLCSMLQACCRDTPTLRPPPKCCCEQRARNIGESCCSSTDRWCILCITMCITILCEQASMKDMRLQCKMRWRRLFRRALSSPRS